MNDLFSGNLAIREQARTLFAFILTAGPVTRPAILDHLALPPTTLNRALDRLKSDGLILESGQADSTGGRPASLFSVRSDARLILGISVADHQVTLALLDLAQSPVIQDTVSISSEPGTDEWSAALERAVVEWIETVPNARPRLCCVGLALLNAKLPHPLVNDLRSRLERRLDCPVSVENMRSSTGALLRSSAENTRRIALLAVGDNLTIDWSDEATIAQGESNTSKISAILVTDPLNLEPYEHVTVEDLVTIGAIARRFSMMRDAKSLRFDDFLAAFQQEKKKAVRLGEATAETLALLLVNIACVTGVTSFLPTGDLFERWPELFDLTAEKIPAKASLAGVTIHWSKPEHTIQDGAVGAAVKSLERILSRSAQFKEPVQRDSDC